MARSTASGCATHSVNAARWASVMQAWRFSPNRDAFTALERAYAEPHRHYHDASHIASCLKHLDSCLAQASEPCELELAIWFHDAIYETFGGQNEEKSVRWAVSFLSENDAPLDATARVEQLILVTKHDRPPVTNDQALIIDIDLAILGASEAEYAAFEEGVRREYRLVPFAIFRRKRADVLQGFLERDHIYTNEPFRSEREHRARANLLAAISRLRGDS
jgi:predicted metal-dependent HD superfamily phosphohydrolase